MGSIVVAGLPSSRKTPGVYMNVVLGGPGSGGGAPQDRLMLVGNMLEAALSFAAPAMPDLPAGTATLAQPVQVFSESDAIDKFGRGSELHLMCKAALAQDPNVPLWATPCGQAAGAVKASSTLILSGTGPTSALTIALTIAGVRVEFVVDAKLSTETDDQSQDRIGAAIAQTVLDNPDFPVTAQYNAATNTVTFTAKQGGTRGNLYAVRVDITLGTRTYRLRQSPGALAATVATCVFTLSSQYLASGAGTESSTFTTVVANLASQRWYRIALAVEDASNLAAMATQIASKAGPTQMLWEQMIAANTRDFTTATVGAKAVALALMSPRAQLVWHRFGDKSPGVIAAQVGAARLMGDSNVGGSCVGESTDCAANLDATLLATIPEQELVSDRPIPAEIEAALNFGVCPLVGSPAHPGGVQIVRSITTRYQDATGAANYAVLDTSEVTTTDYVAGKVRSAIQTTYARAKLADDTNDPPRVKGVVQPKMLKSFIAAILKDEESQGHIINVDKWADSLLVERDSNARGRANAEIPIEPAPSFHQFGGNVRQVAS
jgi:phage tail sheath gpL-like